MTVLMRPPSPAARATLPASTTQTRSRFLAISALTASGRRPGRPSLSAAFTSSVPPSAQTPTTSPRSSSDSRWQATNSERLMR